MERYQPPQPEQKRHPNRASMIIEQFLDNSQRLEKLAHTRGTTRIRMEARNALAALNLEEQATAVNKLIMDLAKETNKTKRHGAEVLLKQINLKRLDSEFLKQTFITAIEKQDLTPNTGIDYALQRVGKMLAPYLPEDENIQKEINYAWTQTKPNLDKEILELHNQGLLSNEIGEQLGIVFSAKEMKAARERFKRKGQKLQPLTRGGLSSKIQQRREEVANLDELGFKPKEIAEKLGEDRAVIRRDLYLQRKNRKAA